MKQEGGRLDDAFAHPDSSRLLRYDPGLLSSPAQTDRSAVLVSDRAAIMRAREVAPTSRAPGNPVLALRDVSVGYAENDGEPIEALAWVVVWFDSPPDVKGPPQPPDKKAAMIAALFCVVVVVVDAMSGEALDVRQFCRRRTPSDI